METDEPKIESGVQLFTRIKSQDSMENINPIIFGRSESFQNETTEIVAPSHIDKSDLLLDFLVRCTLPSSVHKSFKGLKALLLNTNHQINVLRIIKVMDQHLKKLNIANRKPEIESALKKLTIVNCFSKSELILAVHNIEKNNLQQDIRLVVLDDIVSFYWVEKREFMSTYGYAFSVLDNIGKILKSMNVEFIFGRTENSTQNIKKRLKCDSSIILNKLDDSSYEGTVSSFEDKSKNVIKFNINEFIVNFK